MRGPLTTCVHNNTNSYYVKWIEAAGAQVVPVPYNLTESQVEELFMKLNGILFTGGGLSLSKHPRSSVVTVVLHASEAAHLCKKFVLLRFS